MSAFNDEESLVKQTLGFKPKQFCREVSDMVISTLEGAIATYKKELLAIATSKGYANITEDVIDDSCQELLERMKGEYNKNMDKFELYALRNIFTLPSPEESITALESKTSLNNTINELNILRLKYMDIQSQSNILKHECNEGEILLKDMKQAIFNLKVGSQILETSPDGASDGNVSSSISNFSNDINGGDGGGNGHGNMMPINNTMKELNKKQLKLNDLCTKAMTLANEMEHAYSQSHGHGVDDASGSGSGNSNTIAGIHTSTAFETGKVTESMR
jgi:hypothetical protein